MKIIDVLNKIANGEEVKFRIKVEDCIYELTEDANLYDITNKEEVKWFIDESWLNEEVEIIEEDKKIYKVNEIKPSQEYCYNNNTQKEVNEKIRERLYDHECYMKDLAKSINEIIDYLNNKENK